MIKNHTYYFGKIPAEYKFEGNTPEGWEEGYYFRFKLCHEDQVNFEDTCNRMMPFNLDNLCEMRDTLNRMINEIALSTVGADYNAVS